MTLSATTSSGSEQSTTQSPQSAGQASNTGTQSSKVQPGTASSLLATSSGNGVPLQGTNLTTLNLGVTTTSTQVKAAPVAPVQRHVNVGLLGLSIAFCLVAVVLFWLTGKSAKNTTV